MSRLEPPALVRTLLDEGRIGADDVLLLRREVFADGIVAAQEADWLFALDAAAREAEPEWGVFFVEALTDYLVEQCVPRGHVDGSKADWLIDKVLRDGRITTDTELELLVHVLDRAESAPASLSAFALAQVEEAVLTGEGPLRRGSLVPGSITADEVDLVRRILHAGAGEGGIAITRVEAEALFDINDSLGDGADDPAWSDLFVKAIANFLMAASGYRPPSREEALRRDTLLDSRPGAADFLARGLRTSLKEVLAAYRAPDLEETWAARNAAFASASAAAARIAEDEARWLAARIGRNGVVHANERALLRFLREESPEIHPALAPLLQQAA